MKRVLKWEVPVDDVIHPIGAGRVVLVDASNPHVVHVWTEEHSDRPSVRGAQVYGTGQPVAENTHWVGSTRVSGFVWHVYAGGVV